MKINKSIVTLFLIPSMTQAAELVMDAPEIVGKTKDEVSQIIGTPVSCGDTKYGEKCTYELAETEIVYINDKADWITVEGIDDKPFSDQTLKLFGLEVEAPSFTSDSVKRWEPLQGLVSVSLFRGANNADYLYIKAFTE